MIKFLVGKGGSTFKLSPAETKAEGEMYVNLGVIRSTRIYIYIYTIYVCVFVFSVYVYIGCSRTFEISNPV